MDVADTILTGDSKKITSTPKTAETRHKKRGRYDSPTLSYTEVVPLTPMPNYNAMDTPEVQRQAQKYGLKKRLGKTKLRAKLKEVYMYTHQTYSPEGSKTAGESGELPSPVKPPLSDSNELLMLNMSEDCNDISRDLKNNEKEVFKTDGVQCSKTLEKNAFDNHVNESAPKHVISSSIVEVRGNRMNDSNEVISLLDSSNEAEHLPPLNKDLSPDLQKDNSVLDTVNCNLGIDDDNVSMDHSGRSTGRSPSLTQYEYFEEGTHDVVDDSKNVISLLDASGDIMDSNVTFPNQHIQVTSGADEVISLLDTSGESLEDSNAGFVRESKSASQANITNSPLPMLESLSKVVDPDEGDHPQEKGGNTSDSTSEIDSQEDAGSDHDELHRSLFISINNSSSSESDSSSEKEEEECKSLMQRLQERKLSTQSHDPDKDDFQSKTMCNDNSNARTKIDFINYNSTSRQLKIEDSNKNSTDANKKDAKTRKKPKLSNEERTLAMIKALRTDDEIYNSILQYQPVYLSRFKTLMSQNEIKISATDLLDFLDNQGITFSTADENKAPRLKVRRKKLKK